MKTHTPGPWYCDPSDTKHDFPARQQVFGGGYLLAEVAGNGKGSSGANARLIAAAPDLLAACKAFLSCKPDERDAIDLEIMVEEAVAKAEPPADDDSIPNIFEGM